MSNVDGFCGVDRIRGGIRNRRDVCVHERRQFPVLLV